MGVLTCAGARSGIGVWARTLRREGFVKLSAPKSLVTVSQLGIRSVIYFIHMFIHSFIQHNTQRAETARHMVRRWCATRAGTSSEAEGCGGHEGGPACYRAARGVRRSVAGQKGENVPGEFFGFLGESQNQMQTSKYLMS